MAYDLEKLIELHNAARAESWWSLKPVYKNGKLMRYAQDWADTMAKRGRMTHSNMRSIMEMGFWRASENIAWNQQSEEAVMRAWLRSWGHRANIMAAGMDSVGCGVADAGRGPYWCVCFGARK